MPDALPPEGGPPRKLSGPLAAFSVLSIMTAAGLAGFQLIDPAQAEQAPGALGTVPGWITSGGIMGILGLLIYWQLGNRKISVDSDVQQNVDKADIRDHYADEVAALRKRLDEAGQRNVLAQTQIEERYKTLLTVAETRYRTATAEIEEHYKGALKAAEQRHDECVADRDALRNEVRALYDEVAGLRRQITTQATDRVLALGQAGAEPPSEHVLGAAERMKDRLDNGTPPEGGDSAEES